MANPKSDGDTSLTLMLRLQKNPSDESAWSEFVERYRPMIRDWCVKWGSQNCDADDVAQDVLVRLLKAMSKFQYDPAQLPRVAQGRHAQRSQRFRLVPPIEIGRDQRRPRRDRRFQRCTGRPGREDGRCVQPRAARPGHAADRTPRQADDLASLPVDRPGKPRGAEVAEELGMAIALVFVARHRVQKMLEEEVRTLRGS